jgi:membrane protein implicated in regulation of membrane protease activity
MSAQVYQIGVWEGSDVTILWTAATIIFLFIEGITAGLASIWFAIGAAAALVCTLLGAPLWLQIVMFIIVSAATLVLTRPLVKKYVNTKSQPTNADRLVGMTGTVKETIHNLDGTGTVLAGGKLWSARSVNGDEISQKTLVTVDHIEGVHLIVKPAAAKEAAVTESAGAAQETDKK